MSYVRPQVLLSQKKPSGSLMLRFPKGTMCMQMRDTLGPLYDDAQFAALFSSTGQPAEALSSRWCWCLQFAESLSDRQAADAVRGRIDWKYALALELTDPGFDASVLSEFRTSHRGADHLLLEPLLRRLEERDLLKARGTQRTDSTHILAAIRTSTGSNWWAKPCATR